MNTSYGLVTIDGHLPVAETVQHLKDLLASKGLHLFTVIDHSGEAEKAGLHMPDTKLVIFGSPKAGTPLMLAAPSIAIDLPLKILIAEGADGSTKITYTAPEYLIKRHGLAAAAEGSLAGIVALAQAIA